MIGVFFCCKPLVNDNLKTLEELVIRNFKVYPSVANRLKKITLDSFFIASTNFLPIVQVSDTVHQVIQLHF